jgi:hypothetical protein
VAWSAQITVTQDLVGLADAQGTAGWDTSHKSQFDFLIRATGFDEECKPYAVVDVDTSDLLSGSRPSSWWVNSTLGALFCPPKNEF